jgi:hypothetical protein
MSISEVRFGVAEELPQSALADSMSIRFAGPPPGRPVRLTIRRTDFVEQVVFEAKLRIASSVLSFLPSEHDLWSFVAPHVTFLMRAPVGNTDPKIDGSLLIPGTDKRSSLREVALAAKALRLMAGEHPFEFAVKLLDPPAADEAVLVAKSGSGDVTDAAYRRAIEDAQFVADLFGLPELRLDDPVELEEQGPRLRALAAFAQGVLESDITLRVPLLDSGPEGADEAASSDSGDVTVVAKLEALLGDYHLVQCFAVRGRASTSHESGQTIVNVGSRTPLLLSRRAIPRGTASSEMLLRIVAEESANLDSMGLPNVLRPGGSGADR